MTEAAAFQTFPKRTFARSSHFSRSVLVSVRRRLRERAAEADFSCLNIPSCSSVFVVYAAFGDLFRQPGFNLFPCLSLFFFVFFFCCFYINSFFIHSGLLSKTFLFLLLCEGRCLLLERRSAKLRRGARSKKAKENVAKRDLYDNRLRCGEGCTRDTVSSFYSAAFSFSPSSLRFSFFVYAL